MGGNMSQKSKSCSWAAEYVDWKKNVRLCGGRYIMSLELKGIWNNPPCRFLMQKRGIIRKNENGLRGMKGNYKAMTKQSSKVHFTVQTRTFLSDNVSGDSSVIHVSASLILKNCQHVSCCGSCELKRYKQGCIQLPRSSNTKTSSTGPKQTNI